MKTLTTAIALAFFALTSAPAFAADKPVAKAEAKAADKAASAAADKKPAKKEKKGGC